MTGKERITFLKQSLTILEGLGDEIIEKIANAQEGISEGNANLIIGSLVGIDQAAQHLKNVYEAMVFIHQGK